MTTAAAMPRPRILVADDEADIRRLVAELLTEAGYEVDEARDGVETLRRIDINAPDLLILDLMMPQIDGWSVLKWLETRGNALPVIVVTGNGEFNEQRPVPKVAALVTKPFSFSMILSLCDALTLRRCNGPAW